MIVGIGTDSPRWISNSASSVRCLAPRMSTRRPPTQEVGMPIHRSTRCIPATITAALVAAPSALAMPIQGAVGAGPESDADSPIVVTRPAGFSWADAAVGAGLALSLCAVVLAIVILFRHRTGMSHRAIGALAVALVAAAAFAAPAIAVADSHQPTIQDESFQRSFIVGQ